MGEGTTGTNPTLSANLSLFRINNLTGDVGSLGASRLFFAPEIRPQVVENRTLNRHVGAKKTLSMNGMPESL